jgi:hypothetical protein
MSEPQPIDPPLDPALAKMCESLGAKIKASPAAPDPGPPAKVIQLPLLRKRKQKATL